MTLYGATAMLTLMAAVYLWLRRSNALDPTVNAPREVRRWASAFLFTATASHVWWFVLGVYWLEDDRLVRNITLLALDHVTLVPLVMVLLLRMLQDCRRRLWPWFLLQLPTVAIAVTGIVARDGRAADWMNAWQSVAIATFIVCYFRALTDYNRWLQQNYADLEHKDVWQSMLVVGGLTVVYELYCTNPGVMHSEYLSQFFTIAVTCFLVWRVETLQTLAPSEGKPAATVPLDFGPQLQARCEATRLYLLHDLTLAQLAAALGTNRTYLSAYFAQAGTTYNAYINQLRITHFERRYTEAMAVPGKAAVTAKDLAAECGFSSYSTFSAAFKKHRGVSVADWIRQQK